MKEQTFTIREYLGHHWDEELVGFPWPEDTAALVTDAEGGELTVQQANGKVWFIVDELEDFGALSYTCRPAGEQTREEKHCASAHVEDDLGTVMLTNGVIAIRVPASQVCEPEPEGQSLPGPVLAVRKGDGNWVGAGTLSVSPDLQIKEIRFETVEQGPLWCTYTVTYAADEARVYRVTFRLRADLPHVEIAEHSSLLHKASWTFDMYPNFEPTRCAWGHHPTPGGTTLKDLRYDGRMHIGDLQAPDQNLHFFDDDFDAVAFMNDEDAVGIAALDDGDWTYLPENPISMLPETGPKMLLRASCKAGVRKWGLLLTDAEATSAAEFFQTPLGRFRRKYETTLDWVKDLVLEWEDLPPEQRPHAICKQEDIERARRLFREWEPLKQYGDFIDRDAELVQGQYDAGGHYPLNDEHREDPMCAWLMEPDPRIAEKIKRGLIEGLRRRVDAFLGPQGHRASIITSINLGRTLRPFVHMYDILAPHMKFTSEEKRYFMAALAFLAYKANDPNYWNAEAIVLHSDHPRSSHRTAWFPSRDSDWCTYNIDTAPHNFHVDVYTAMGSVALTFPTHPESRKWLDQTIQYVERELDNWVFPTGAFIESATYTLATLHWWAPWLACLKHAKVKDYFLDERFQRMCYCLARVQGPFDRRIQRHSFTVMGDAMYPSGGGDTLAWCAHLGREDPDYSAALMGAWERAGCQLNNPGQQGLSFYDALFIDPDLPGDPLTDLPSEHVKGLGLVLRHAHGTKDEVYFFIKCGKIYSHFHFDEGAFFVFADGVPLLDEYGVQYGSGTDQDAQTVRGHMPQLHNAISFSDTPTDRECYNRGWVTRFTPTPFGDFAVCEMPVHLLHMKEGMSLWGFTGEEAPYGWWRRHILFIKPHGFFFYDELESEFTATLDLNFKADEYVELAGLSRVYKGRYGTDIPVCVNAPLEGELRDGRLDMQANKASFPKFSTMENVPQAMKDTFYNQVSMHYRTSPNTDFSWAFAWAKPDMSPRLMRLGDGVPGSVLRMEDREVRALCGPWLRPAVEYADDVWRYRGWAGAIVNHEDGARELIQLHGGLIGLADGVQIEGDGPFRANVRGEKVVIETTRRAGWLLVGGVDCDRVTCDGERMPIEKLDADRCRIFVPAGEHMVVFG